MKKYIIYNTDTGYVSESNFMFNTYMARRHRGIKVE